MHERDLLNAAFEIVDPTARQEYLDAACAGNSALRVRVERLLSRAAQAADFLEQPADALCSDFAAGLLTEAVKPSLASSSQGRVDDVASTVGTMFGRYRVERVLGSGGMGVVYLAEDIRLGRRVALKIPKFDADGKLHLSERFRREARTMASVQHRNLCPIFDVDEQDGKHYLTMSFIDGEPLSQIIRQGTSFAPRQIAELIRKLAQGLEAAHRAGVVHRDLKPANVMIDRDGEPILMDFGLAWLVHDADSRVTQTGEIIGTPAYMSPEQAERDPDKVGAASDIYSLGVILYELLTGRPIRSGSVKQTLFKLMHETPARPNEIRGDVDPWLEEICCKAISPRPEDRFATAAEFAAALASFSNRENETLAEPRVGELRTGERHGSADRTGVLPQDEITIADWKPQAARRSKWRIALASLLLAGVLGAVWVMIEKPRKVETSNPIVTVPSSPVAPSRQSSEPATPNVPVDPGKPFVVVRDGQDERTFNTLVAAIDPDQVAMTGTGRHLPLAPISATITPVSPTYVKSPHGFTGTWTATTPAAWRGTFTGIGLLPRDNTGTHSTKYDFSGLPRSVLAAGTYFGLTDLDTVESLKLKAYDATHTVMSSPWLNLHPISQLGQGTGTGSPGQVLPTDMPGWKWDESTQTYVIEGTGIVGNPNITFFLSSREAIGFLEVTREVTGFNFHLMAPAAAPVPSGLPVEIPRPAIASFDHNQARTHQVAWAEHLGVLVEYTNSIGMKFILIPPGEFMMGSAPAEIDEAVQAIGENDWEDRFWQRCIKSEGPQHKVILTKPIYLGVHEVTQAEFETVMGNHPSDFASTGDGRNFVAGLNTTNHPVEMVSWGDAAEFCAKLSQLEKLQPFYLRAGETVTPLDGTGYRLPTEAQWEFACRAGTTTKFSHDERSENLESTGWLDRNSGRRTHAVGELKANPFGLHDMHGNVWEYVQDGWEPTYYEQFRDQPAIDPSGSPAKDSHVLRGGHWRSTASICRASSRTASTLAIFRLQNCAGFRVALEVNAVKAAIAKRAPAVSR